MKSSNSRYLSRPWLFLPWVGVIAGCGQPALVPFPAKFTLDGKPLDKAAVTLVSVESEPRRPASGLTAADGSVVMTTYKLADGVRPGKYKVCVCKTPITHVDVRGGVSDSKAATKEDYEAYFKASSQLAPPVGGASGAASLLPTVYMNPGTTPLECVVPLESDNVVFALESTKAGN